LIYLIQLKSIKLVLLVLIGSLLFNNSCGTPKKMDELPTKSYNEVLAAIQTKKKELKAKYDAANTTEKKLVIEETRVFLFNQLTNEIFPSWYGTNWDYNGVTEKPKEGAIACGYFVTTTLSHLGLNIPRVKWAQAASETMIIAATPEITRFSEKKIEDIEKWLLEQDDAIYMVGLDSHTGFVYKKGNELWSVHSSPWNSQKGGVVIEPIDADAPLKSSKYRIFGKLFLDDMVKAWLTNKVYL
jgi:hypothetical protein